MSDKKKNKKSFKEKVKQVDWKKVGKVAIICVGNGLIAGVVYGLGTKHCIKAFSRGCAELDEAGFLKMEMTIPQTDGSKKPVSSVYEWSNAINSWKETRK